jgi:hypothetical protein
MVLKKPTLKVAPKQLEKEWNLMILSMTVEKKEPAMVHLTVLWWV